MARIAYEVGIYDAIVEVSGLPEVETDTTVRVYVRTGRKSGTGSAVYDEVHTVFGTSLPVYVEDLNPDTWYTANASLNGGTTWIGAVEFKTDPEEEEEIPIEAWYECEATDTAIEFSIYDLYAGQYGFCYVKNSSGVLLWGSGDDESYFEATRNGQIKTVTLDGLEPGETYTVNVEVYTNTGESELLGVDTIKTLGGKPKEWYWWSTVESGATISLSAKEWNAFTEKINEVRTYLDMLTVSDFTTAKGGETAISESIVNEAWDAIDEMTDGVMPARAVSGQPITAAFFNGLKDALNAIL